MSFSDNVEKLLGKSVTIKELNTLNANNLQRSTVMNKGEKAKEPASNPASNFNKLLQPNFLKWVVPAVTSPENTLIPINQLDGTSNVPSPEQEKPWHEMTARLNAAKKT